jgi:hypothetical protein
VGSLYPYFKYFKAKSVSIYKNCGVEIERKGEPDQGVDQSGSRDE